MTATLATSSLTAADRCDRCGARAYVRVVMPGGGDLLFCAHHSRAHDAAIKAQALHVHDERHALDETSAAAPDGER